MKKLKNYIVKNGIAWIACLSLLLVSNVLFNCTEPGMGPVITNHITNNVTIEVRSEIRSNQIDIDNNVLFIPSVIPDFAGQTLSNVFFENTNLSWANFEKATFKGLVKLINVSLIFANFKDASVGTVSSTNVDWRYASFFGATIAGLFVNGNLENAKFINTTSFGPSFFNCNLSNTSFLNSDMKNMYCFNSKGYKVNFQNTILTEARISNTDLLESYFQNANMEGCRLLSKVNFSGSIFSNTRMNSSPFKDVTFSNATIVSGGDDILLYTSFGFARLSNVDFSGALIQDIYFNRLNNSFDVSFQGAVIRRCDFENGRVININFNNALIANCNFNGIVFNNATFSNTRFAEGISNRSAFATLIRGQDLSFSVFATNTNMHLTGLNLRGARLSHATLTHNNFSNSDLQMANFSNANLSNVDFRHARNVHLANFTNAHTNGALLGTNAGNITGAIP